MVLAEGDTVCATLVPASLSQQLEPQTWQCWLRRHSVSEHQHVCVQRDYTKGSTRAPWSMAE